MGDWKELNIERGKACFHNSMLENVENQVKNLQK